MQTIPRSYATDTVALRLFRGETPFLYWARWLQGYFKYQAPVLALQDSDQDLLIAALKGLTDKDLAQALDLQLSAVKMRWRSIFERLGDLHPDLFPTFGVKAIIRGVALRSGSMYWNTCVHIRKNCGGSTEPGSDRRSRV